MGDRRESQCATDREAGKAHQLSFPYRVRVAKLKGGDGGAINAQDGEIVLAISFGDLGWTNLCLALVIA